jgi:N-methylhydantoinase B
VTTVETVRVQAGVGTSAGSVDPDPITTEVIRHALIAAADQMRLALVRTAFSPVIYEMADFAAALYDRQIRLLAQAKALPLFMGTLSFCIEAMVKNSGGEENLEPGDVIFSTYAYDIGSHPQDAAIVIPAFYEGALLGYAAVKAHNMDIGAKEIFSTDTVDNFQEGAIFPSVKLYRRGELQGDLYRTILANSRMPEELAGDLSAQIGAAKIGLNGLFRVIDRYGLERFQHSVERMLDHGERLIRDFFGAIPDGQYVGEAAMDSDGITDELVPFDVTVEVEGSNVVFDFSSSPPEQAGPINTPLPAVVSASRIAIMTLAGGNESANEGHFRPLQVRTRPGTMFHPLPPAPVFMYGWPAMAALDAIHKALADAIPQAVTAGSGADCCAVGCWGKDVEGEFWGDVTDHYTGVGATHASDGTCPLMHIACSGLRNTPIEVWEARRPFLVEKFEYGPDSGGIGRFRGGLGVDIHYRALRDCQLVLPWERMKTPPWGLDGGHAGRPGRIRLRDPGGTTQDFNKITGLHMPEGSVLELSTSGGGGFGPPAERDPSAVHADVREGLLTAEAARRDYPHAFPE